MREYKIYKIVVFVGDLVHGRFEVAAEGRLAAQQAGEKWCAKRGYTPGFNCRVSVMRKASNGVPATINVA